MASLQFLHFICPCNPVKKRMYQSKDGVKRSYIPDVMSGEVGCLASQEKTKSTTTEELKRAAQNCLSVTPLYTLLVKKSQGLFVLIYILWLKVPFPQSENLQRKTKAKRPIFHTFLELLLKTNSISKSSFPWLSKFNFHIKCT